MKRIIISLLTIIIALSLVSCNSEKNNTNNNEQSYNCNDFTVYDYEGNSVSLYDIVSQGKPVVINYWTSWCPYCLQEMPDFNDVYKEYEGKVNFMMIDVNGSGNDDKEAAKAYVTEQAFDFPVYYDDRLSAAMANNIGSYPTTLIIDSEGNEIYNKSGKIPASVLISFIEEAM